jgi:hypothetical protein
MPVAQERLAQYRTTYRDQNRLIITPDMARLPRFQREVGVTDDGVIQYAPIFTDDDFTAAGGQIEVPSDPDVFEQVAAVLPFVWPTVERPVLRAIGLLMIPNDEVLAADTAGTVDQLIDERVRSLLHTAGGDELIQLAVALVTIIVETIGSPAGELGKAAEQLAGEPVEDMTVEAPAVSATSPRSSTSTPTPTAGPATTSSTASHSSGSVNLGG